MSEMSLSVRVMCKSSCLYAQCSVTLLDLFLKLCIDKTCVALYCFTRFITLDLLFFLNQFGFLRAICLSVYIHVPECTSRHCKCSNASLWHILQLCTCSMHKFQSSRSQMSCKTTACVVMRPLLVEHVPLFSFIMTESALTAPSSVEEEMCNSFSGSLQFFLPFLESQ